MSKRTLSIVIDSGDKVCTKAPGEFCPWMRTRRMGSIYECGLFGKELRDDKGVLSGLGWLQRLPECMDAEKEPT